VKLTTARYYTPGGRSIQAKGIAPDIVVDDAAEARVLLREADLQHHLSIEEDKSAADAASKPAVKPTDKIIAGPAAGKSATAAKGAAGAAAKADAKDAKPADPNAKKEDLQLAAALNHLKGLPITASAPAAAATK